MKKETIKVVVVGLLAFGIGFFGGMEYKAYQIRSAVEDAFSGVFDKSSEEEVIEEERPAVSNDLTNKVGFKVTDKSFSEGDFSDSNVFTFEFTNMSGKDIAGVKGTIVFNDIFGDQIKRVTLSYDEEIKTGESKLYRASVDYNQFMDEDITLRQTDIEKLQYKWEVDTIIYADGTKESM